MLKRSDCAKILGRQICHDEDPTNPNHKLCYLVEWKDGTTTWVPVRTFKRSGKEAKAMAAEYEEKNGMKEGTDNGTLLTSVVSWNISENSLEEMMGTKEDTHIGRSSTSAPSLNTADAVLKKISR